MTIEEMKIWIQKYNQQLIEFLETLSDEEKIIFLDLTSEELEGELQKCQQ
jgi:hypothetical protein